eukprot:CAMPEP_0197527294 /NCGR_PEP_ID=MMETSP1318-20131121/20984_1 /TAXON_ID=552666 /ORGANISM="Partenskyella glossopodia, Strain RCC365" /LENGTH=183 /DNA_ID=CAMNT_0043081851 /DNA_START=425 /DNA_END=973 /DNA_ORIENTATION=+
MKLKGDFIIEQDYNNSGRSNSLIPIQCRIRRIKITNHDTDNIGGFLKKLTQIKISPLTDSQWDNLLRQLLGTGCQFNDKNVRDLILDYVDDEYMLSVFKLREEIFSLLVFNARLKPKSRWKFWKRKEETIVPVPLDGTAIYRFIHQQIRHRQEGKSSGGEEMKQTEANANNISQQNHANSDVW